MKDVEIPWGVTKLKLVVSFKDGITYCESNVKFRWGEGAYENINSYVGEIVALPAKKTSYTSIIPVDCSKLYWFWLNFSDPDALCSLYYSSAINSMSSSV